MTSLGIPWFAAVLSLLYLFSESEVFPPLLVGLIFDITYVALIKAFSRRRRPDYAQQDDQFGVVLADKHSFPSGHASRAIYVAVFFNNYSILSFLVWIWASAVCCSRVLLGRHHIADVIAGVVLGFLNYLLQFTVGLPLNNGLIWLVSSALGVSFSNKQDNDIEITP